MPTNATAAGSNQGGGGLDSSGWNITFGNDSGIEAARAENASMSPVMMYVLIAVGGVLAWRYIKKL